MKVRICLLQLTLSSDPLKNFSQAEEKIRNAAIAGAQIICLPELFRTLYFCNKEEHKNFQLAESVPGPSTEQLSKLAKELQVVLISPLFEKRGEGLYHNTAAVIDADGKYLGKYRKMHIPDDPGYHEKFYFTPGDLGYQVFPTRYGKIGVLICWDQWYPEASRITALKGAQIIFYPTAIGWATSGEEGKDSNDEQFQAWQLIQRSHAIANGIYVASVNRVGKEGGIHFWGGSFIANPFGRILQEAKRDIPATLLQEIDLTDSNYYRTYWPFLRDRRIDSYEPINQRYLEHP